VPLVIIAFARRNLRETERFAREAGDEETRDRSFGRILRTPYRARVFQLAAIWALTLFCTQNAVTFWKEFAIAERGMSDAQVGSALAIASLASLPFLFFVGKVLDVIGRRRGAVVAFLLTTVGVTSSYTLESPGALTFALVIGILGTGSVLPVLNTFTAELFPTELRSEAFAWANNLIGRTAYLASPLILGWSAGHFGWGPTVATTAMFPLVALALILAFLPETVGRELEETSRL
jgi:MFS transporter, putative metabolite:H+ symporter